jgi:predicted Zn-dependent protease
MTPRLAPATFAAALALTGCATNPVSGGHDVVLTSVKGEVEASRRDHEQIIKAYGIYADQAVQDYVNAVGQRVAANSQRGSELTWHFTVLDDGEVNAFTTGGGYVYVFRGLLTYLNSEAELAAVLGHEIGHVNARHPVQAETRNVLATVLATGAVLATGSSAVAEMANIGATAWVQGYGREAETQADALGVQYATKTGYLPEAMSDSMKVMKQQESFEVDRARIEGREPQIYHGVFSDHPAPDDRVVATAKAAANITTTPEGGWRENREEYLKAINGLPYGSSRAQGIVRDNRFYHADMHITLAFPRGWTVDNERDRLLAYAHARDSHIQDALMQLTADVRPEKKSPREYLLEKLRGASITHGESLTVNGMEGYTVVTRSGSPLDGGEGPVRWAVLYRDKSVFLIGGASRSSEDGLPLDDGLFLSSIRTIRNLRPAEYPLAEPYRIKVIEATEQTKLDDYAKNVPKEKYQKEELLLLNGLYPKGKLTPGQLVKVVE